MTAFRAGSSGIPYVNGYDSISGSETAGCYGSLSGSVNAGRASYTSLSQIQGAVTDLDIYATIAATKAEGTTAWVQLSN
jgi:hypothetical protein